MKKLLGIVVLSLLWCNVGFTDISNLIATHGNIKELLKGKYKCQSISIQSEWTLSFSRKYGGKGTNYYIKNDSDKISDKRFASLSGTKLLWYYLLPVEGDKALISNVLKLDSKNTPLNFESIIIFFDTDFLKEQLKKLEKASNKSELVFFNEANNFFHAKIKTNNASSGNWGYASSGSWEIFDKAICKSDQL